jgi:hypothetical protein
MNGVFNRPEDKIRQLALMFPCVLSAPGIESWDAERLDSWDASAGPSHGEKCSARFILAVWNPDHEWQSGKFELMEALRIWDQPSHKASLVWVDNPWWGLRENPLQITIEQTEEVAGHASPQTKSSMTGPPTELRSMESRSFVLIPYLLLAVRNRSCNSADMRRKPNLRELQRLGGWVLTISARS